ncbi:ANTAR domain-containing protein [Pseudarthrobacter sulfonivorans]|uniref:ANTAR domain-containing protein n=1 Tax=Pseudarthrobacter sulfonivorans TaxID=121292 RepID=UPI0021064862|nr:GAF and ANTAR domain-containing protein [Pseudarthrobacter sulfonivorans]
MAGESTADTAPSITDHLHEELLNSSGVEEFLAELARVSARTLCEPGDGLLCGITLLRQRKAATMAGNGDTAHVISRIEYETGNSPGITAAEDQETVHVPDLELEDRWPEYAEAVLGHGIRSVLVIPFRLEGETKASLLLYSPRAGHFERRILETAQEFVRQTSLALRLAVRFAHYSETAAHLRATLESRTVIDMAVGIIMAQNRCSQQEAFSLLKAASSTRNSKLHTVAAAVVNALGHGPAETHYEE